MFEKQLQQLELLEPLVNATNNDEIKLDYNFLYERIKNPSTYLVFMGKTSSGKSSIINGFLDRNILPVSTAPSTARITEVVLSTSVEEDTYYEFLTNLKCQKVPAEDFISYSKRPQEDTARFKVVVKTEDSKFHNLSILDTPGFGSADFKNHNQILTDFLPNSDIVVYTVTYIGGGGISVMDLPYLGQAANLLEKNVEAILVINRCPETVREEDKRIQEIKEAFIEHTGFTPKIFFVKDYADGKTYNPRPKCPELWEYILSLIQSETRQQLLEQAFDNLISVLFQRCKSNIEWRCARENTPIDQYNKVCAKASEAAANIRKLIGEEIEPTYNRLLDTIPRLLDKAAETIIDNLISRIQSSENAKMDETKVMILSHLLPFNVRQEAKKLENYCSEILLDLNRKCKDYINKELQHFNDAVFVIINSNTEEAVKNLGENIIKNVLSSYVEKQILQKSSQILIQDGIKNLSNQFLSKATGQFVSTGSKQFISKSTSNLVSKAVSQSTDDVARVLVTQMSANVMKAVNIGISVIVEMFTLGIDLATWKDKLCKAVEKGVSSWREEALGITEDINKSKELNKNNFENFAKEWEKQVTPKKTSEVVNCEKLLVILKETQNRLGE